MKLLRFFSWAAIWRGLVGFGGWVATDIRSAGVGAVVALVSTVVWQTYMDQQQTKFSTIGATNGVGSPSLLFDLALQEGEVTLNFKPAEVKETRVCEYSAHRGASYWDIAFEYLQKYSACFIMSPRSPTEFDIRPNEFSGLMKRNDQGQYICSCED